MSDHLFGKSCSIGIPYAIYVICLFVDSPVIHLGFEDMRLVLIVPVPGQCLSSKLWTFQLVYMM